MPRVFLPRLSQKFRKPTSKPSARRLTPRQKKSMRFVCPRSTLPLPNPFTSNLREIKPLGTKRRKARAEGWLRGSKRGLSPAATTQRFVSPVETELVGFCVRSRRSNSTAKRLEAEEKWFSARGEAAIVVGATEVVSSAFRCDQNSLAALHRNPP